MASFAPPVTEAPSLNRPTFRILKAIFAPSPILPMRLVAGILQSDRINGVVDDDLIPILCSSAPGRQLSFLSTTNAENLSFSPSTLAKTMNTSAKLPFEMNIFSPFSVYVELSSLSFAVVLAPCASEPEPASVRQYAATTSPQTIFGIQVCFIASEPKYN